MKIFDGLILLAYASSLSVWMVSGIGYVLVRRFSNQIPESDFVRLQAKLSLIDRARTYVCCALFALGLFPLCLIINFWRGCFPFPGSETVAGVCTMTAYLSLTLVLIAPLFYALQVALERRLTGKLIRHCCLAFDPILHLLFFSTLLIYLLPLSEAFRFSLGLSHQDIAVVRFFILSSALFGTLPLIPILMMISFKMAGTVETFRAMRDKDFIFKKPFLDAPACPILFRFLLNRPSASSRLKEIRMNDLIFQIEFLAAEDFSLNLLDSKPDQDINTLIDVARFSRNLEKADLISNY
ncbi:MAG: hypothetical protein JST01_17910, partial [Cyanobacteria bacterium SZAS TMP-1]|nr:hypothetical protein [Cyanobacteria bacterium SZAS TMP-1]